MATVSYEELTPDFIRWFCSQIERPAPGLCWHWRDHTGKYPKYISFGDKRGAAAHVLAFMLGNRTNVPPKMEVCHVCDNGLCVNPFHLWLGTRKENAQDIVRKGLHHNARGFDREAIKRELRAVWGY